MSTEDLKTIVRERYGEAARRATTGGQFFLLRRRLRLRHRGSDHLRPLLPGRDGGASRGGRPRLARLRQSHGPGRAQGGRGRARPRLRRRDRRAALRPARRADRQGLRARHDRRDAGARPREPAQGRRRERRVPPRRDRGDSAARQLGGRDHLQLRRQSLGRQAEGDRRGVPGAQAGRPVRGLGCRGAGRDARSGPPEHGAVGRLRRGGADRGRVPRPTCWRPASSRSTSSPPASTNSRMRGRSWAAPASTPRSWPARWAAA